MTIWLNGEERELPAGLSLADAVEAAGAPPGRRGIAVAVDGEVVPRDRWDQTRLDEGQRVEVVQAVQGG
ncbi:MAG: sulfur carrier protein ThiS [Thermoleophilaceae bacterium]|jgi:sulfur carrier protein